MREKPNSKLWRYVIADDDGSAPNYDPPFTTLAICKPRIRKRAERGDAILAFAGRSISRDDPHKVVWAGWVKEMLTFEEYWADSRFQSKKPRATKVPDNIYRPGRCGLVQVRNRIHGRESVRRDCSGEFVLVLKPVWWLNPDLSSLPEQFSSLRLSRKNRRGHRVSRIGPSLAAELNDWLKSRATSRPPAAGQRTNGGKSASRCKPCGTARPVKSRTTRC
jgi:putative DNA base modification enzyme with NMAD domain